MFHSSANDSVKFEFANDSKCTNAPSLVQHICITKPPHSGTMTEPGIQQCVAVLAICTNILMLGFKHNSQATLVWSLTRKGLCEGCACPSWCTSGWLAHCPHTPELHRHSKPFDTQGQGWSLVCSKLVCD